MTQGTTARRTLLTFWLPLLLGVAGSAIVLAVAPDLWWAGVAVLLAALAVAIGLDLARRRRDRR